MTKRENSSGSHIYGNSETYSAASENRLPVTFDEEFTWDQPVCNIPVRRIPVEREIERRKPGETRHMGMKAFFSIAVIVFSLFGLCMAAAFLMPQLTGIFWKSAPNFAFVNGKLIAYENTTAAEFSRDSEYLAQNVIYPGIFADGVHIGGLTVEQAGEQLAAAEPAAAEPFRVTVQAGDHSWQFDQSNVTIIRDSGEILEKAYAIGRTYSASNIGNGAPFSRSRGQVLALRENGVNLKIMSDYDRDTVRNMVDQIAAYIRRDPVNSQIRSFDFRTRTFTFTDSSAGAEINADELFEQVVSALDSRSVNAVINAEVLIREPSVTKEELEKGFGLISAFTTETTKDSNRNTNIELACKAVNGTALMPGETFSFNKATGERTVSKGYKEAGAISGGQSIEEVGGGICQVSSTIFNAAARADLTIVSRSPHAWPSSYVNMGEDATVNWPNLDFKFRNDTDSPVFLIAYYKNRKLTAEIWGMTLGEGITVDLHSETVKTTEAPTEINYVYNASLDYGESKTTVKARKGYVVDTYKVWYQNGKEIKREKFYTSTYKTYQQTVEYNW